MEVVVSWRDRRARWGRRVKEETPRERRALPNNVARPPDRAASQANPRDKHADELYEIPYAERAGARACSLKHRPRTSSASSSSSSASHWLSRWLSFSARRTGQGAEGDEEWCDHSMRLFTNSRGQRIFAQQWLPRRRSDARRKRREKDTNSPRFKGALFIIHGLNAHSNRYSTLVRQFVAKDYAVFAHDLCGHGRSDGLRAYTSSFNHYIADARMYVQDVVSRNRLQAIPKFLVGHSLGGALAIRLARDDADRARRLGALPPWDGVLLTAPAVAVFPKPLVKLFAPILGTLFPFMRVQSLKARRNFSTSPETTDPLIMTAGVRARVGYEILKSCSEIMNSASSFSTALFIAHAKADRVTSMQGSQRFVERAGSRVKTFRLYDSHVHDLLGNPGLAAQVSRDMLEWVEERVGELAKDS